MIRKFSILVALISAAPAIGDSTISGPPPAPKNESELQAWLDHTNTVAALSLQSATRKSVNAGIGAKTDWGQFSTPHGQLTVVAREGNCATIRQTAQGGSMWDFKACQRTDGGIDIKDMPAAK